MFFFLRPGQLLISAIIYCQYKAAAIPPNGRERHQPPVRTSQPLEARRLSIRGQCNHIRCANLVGCYINIRLKLYKCISLILSEQILTNFDASEPEE